MGVPVAVKFSANCRIAFMVWALKRAKGTAGVELVRASERRLAASVDALVEHVAGMAPLWGENYTVFSVSSTCVYGT